MSDPTLMSDDEILAAMNRTQQTQNQAALTHSVPQRTQPYLRYDPTADMGTGERLLAGIGRGMSHTGNSVGNLLGLVPDSALATQKEIDAPLLATRSGTLGNTLGEAAITAPITMGVTGAVGQLGKLGAGIVGSPIANATLQGGVQGLVTSDPGERTKNAALGAITGGGLAAGAGLVGKLVRGFDRSPSADRLLQEGISLTPGQLNPGGAMNQFEQAGESIPGVKQIIHGARENAEQQFQATVIQKAAAPGATIAPNENIHKMLQDAYDSYAPLYDQAKGYPMQPVIMNQGANVPLSTALTQAAQSPGAPASLKRSANEWLQDQLTKLGRAPDSADFIDLRSNIRARARQMNLSTDINAKDAAGIYERAANVITSSLRSQLPSDALRALDSADSNYGVYKIVENAVAKSKDNLAGLTPQKLSQSIYDSMADPQYARGGGGPLRELAQAGTDVFQTVSPPTGARVATLAAAIPAVTHPVVGVPATAGLLGLVGTQTGRRLAAGQTAPQQAVQRLTGALQQQIPASVRGAAQQLLTRGAVGAGMPVTEQAVPAALAAALLMAPP